MEKFKINLNANTFRIAAPQEQRDSTYFKTLTEYTKSIKPLGNLKINSMQVATNQNKNPHIITNSINTMNLTKLINFF